MSFSKRKEISNVIIIFIYYLLFSLKKVFGLEFLDIKKLYLYDCYFVVLDTGLYLYNFNNLDCSIIQSFNYSIYKSNNNKISINELNEDKNSYIFCLVNEYLFIFDEINNKTYSYQLNEIINNINYHYDLMPYKIENNNISFILYVNKGTAELYFYYYNFLLNENINKPKELSFEDINIENQMVRCQTISNLSFTKCFYYETFNNSYYLSSISFIINNTDINIKGIFSYKVEKNINQIKVAKSFNSNFFICILIPNSVNNDMPNCYINSYFSNYFSRIECYYDEKNIYYDANYKVLYFDETDDFMFVSRYSLNAIIFNNINSSLKLCHEELYSRQENYNSLIYNNGYKLVFYSNFSDYMKCSNSLIIGDHKQIIPSTLINFRNLTYITSYIYPISNILDSKSDIDIIDITSNIDLSSETLVSKSITDTIGKTSYIDSSSNIVDSKSDIDIYEITSYIDSTKNLLEKVSQNSIFINNNFSYQTFFPDNLNIGNNSYNNNFKFFQKFKYTISITDNLEAILTNLTNMIINEKNIITQNELEELVIQKYGATFTFTTTLFQKTKENKINNISIINLGQCESKLKSFYNISEQSELYILKIDYEQKSMNIPIIEYEVYYPLKEGKMFKLNLSLCEDINIEIFIPININQNEIDLHNPNSRYYNDICVKATSEYGTDITLSDRKNEFINKNMTLCEDNCIFMEYNNDNQKARCLCDIKTFISSINEIRIDKDKLMKNFKDFHNIVNLEVIKCYKIAFSKNNLVINYGFFILIFIIIIFFVCLILFYIKFYKKLFDEMNEIVLCLKKPGINLEQNKKKKKKKFKRKKKKKVIDEIKIENAIETNSDNLMKINKKNKEQKNTILICENTHEFISKKKINKIIEVNDNSKNKIENEELNLNKNETNHKNILDYNDYELNNMTYEEALKNDSRNYSKYYLSLLKKKQLIIFSFFSNKDYNSQVIKIFLFFFFLASHLTVNTLFYNDDTMHRIYLDSGSFNLSYHIPQIIYSFLISTVIDEIIKYLSLSEKQIISIKQIKEKTSLDEKEKEIINKLNIKFIMFFIISFVLLLLFLFYLTCFCFVYANTQIHLIKDSIITFCLSFVYPFLINLIPGIFRLKALRAEKKDKEYLYKFSKIIQML